MGAATNVPLQNEDEHEYNDKFDDVDQRARLDHGRDRSWEADSEAES